MTNIPFRSTYQPLVPVQNAATAATKIRLSTPSREVPESESESEPKCTAPAVVVRTLEL